MSALGGNSMSAPKPLVRLRDVDPDFLRFVPEDERQLAGEQALPAIDLTEGPFDPYALLSVAGASCGVVVTGVVNRHVKIQDQIALCVLGPGTAIPAVVAPSSDFTASSQWNAAGTVRLAVLGDRFTRASARWPHLLHNLVARLGEQNEQLAAQLALCQLPRVEDRVLAMLWLLAESWGKVTSAGTLLPLHFTHEALGAMVGARRPTVTLALGELTNGGAVVQREGGWLLLAPPPQQTGEAITVEAPRLLDLSPTAWADPGRPSEQSRARRRELLALVTQLRREHRESVDLLQARLREAEAVRARSFEIRDRVRGQRLENKRPAPGGSELVREDAAR